VFTAGSGLVCHASSWKRVAHGGGRCGGLMEELICALAVVCGRAA
jgi:hypothetical protein